MNAVLVSIRELTPQTLDALAKNNLRALRYIPETDEILFVPSKELRAEPPKHVPFPMAVVPNQPSEENTPVQEV